MAGSTPDPQTVTVTGTATDTASFPTEKRCFFLLYLTFTVSGHTHTRARALNKYVWQLIVLMVASATPAGDLQPFSSLVLDHFLLTYHVTGCNGQLSIANRQASSPEVVFQVSCQSCYKCCLPAQHIAARVLTEGQWRVRDGAGKNAWLIKPCKACSWRGIYFRPSEEQQGACHLH